MAYKKYPWYSRIKNDSKLHQGDIIKSCPILVPKEEKSGKIKADKNKYDVIVMSQTCDLIYKKLNLVLVCPFWSLTEFASKDSFFNSTDGQEQLRKGLQPGYHLLNKCNLKGMKSDFLIVDFRNVYGVPFQELTNLIKKKERLRLLPPYKEHLSPAFARFFMRVGLP
jgi:hypothetical protein